MFIVAELQEYLVQHSFFSIYRSQSLTKCAKDLVRTSEPFFLKNHLSSDRLRMFHRFYDFILIKGVPFPS